MQQVKWIRPPNVKSEAGTLPLGERQWRLRTFIERETQTRGSGGYTPTELEMRMMGGGAGWHGTAHQKRDADNGGRSTAYAHRTETQTEDGGGGCHSTRLSNARRKR